MVIGDTHDIPQEIEDAFRKTNTYHVFAVSGQNVAMILMVGLMILRLTGALRWKWGWILAPPLLFYCLMTGASPSSVRALLMALLVLAAWRLDRPVSGLNLWSLAAMAALVYDPMLIANLSYELSFAVVLALILLTPPIYALIYQPFKPDPYLLKDLVPTWRRRVDTAAKWFLALLASSLAAWLGSFPLLAHYFHQVSVSGMFANLIVVPLAGLIVVVGTLSLGSGLFSHTIAALYNQANWLLAKILVAVVFWFSSLSWSSVSVPDLAEFRSVEKPEIIFLDTPGITSAIVRCKGHAWLINPGSDYMFGKIVNPARQFYGINRFDGIILTESGKGAAGSVELVAKNNLAEKYYAPDEESFSGRSGWFWKKTHVATATQRLKEGQKLELAPGFSLEVLAPFEDQAGRLADRGLVLLFRYKDRALLWAGRIGSEVEQKLLAKYPGLHCDVVAEGFNPQDPNLGENWIHELKAAKIIEVCGVGLKPGAEFSSPTLDWWKLNRTGALRAEFSDNGFEVKPLMPAF